MSWIEQVCKSLKRDHESKVIFLISGIAMCVVLTACIGTRIQEVKIANQTDDTVDLFVTYGDPEDLSQLPPSGTFYLEQSISVSDIRPGQERSAYLWTNTENIGSDVVIAIAIIDVESSESIRWIYYEGSEVRKNDYRITLTNADLDP